GWGGSQLGGEKAAGTGVGCGFVHSRAAIMEVLDEPLPRLTVVRALNIGFRLPLTGILEWPPEVLDDRFARLPLRLERRVREACRGAGRADNPRRECCPHQCCRCEEAPDGLPP